MRLADHLRLALDDLERRGLRRRPVVGTGHGAGHASFDGRPLVSFASNDYLGLSGDPRLAAALADGARRAGAGAGASRLVGGERAVHREAEARLADLVGAEAALLFTSGYAANVGTLSALVGPDDLVLSDALNHASLIDGCRLSRARVRVFPHRDLEALEALLARERPEARLCLVVTDAVFSMDGDVAPLAALAALAERHDADLYVDEAHALGVLGPGGRGACAAAGVVPSVRIGTLGKAFGLAGAFAAGGLALRDLLVNRARSHVFSTGTPPALAHAIGVAVGLVAGADAARATLARHVASLRGVLTAHGVPLPPDPTPIVPLVLGDPAAALAAAARLADDGFFAPAIRPPTIPEGTSRLRLVPTAAHTDDQVAALCAALDRHLTSSAIVPTR